MSSTFSSLRMHLVFSTKQRRPFIQDSWRSALHEYVGGTVRGLGGVAEAIGGVADHVHLLVSYKPTHCVSDFVRELKKAASVWATETHEPRFSWQEGYSVFSVSVSQKERVRGYIANQEAHHRQRDFRAELDELLHKHEIEFDPKSLE